MATSTNTTIGALLATALAASAGWTAVEARVPPDADAARRRRAAEAWVERALAAKLESGIATPADLCDVALAACALAPRDEPASLALRARATARVSAAQRDDGSFATGEDAAATTWAAIALLDDGAAEIQPAVGRALAFLRGGARAAPGPAGTTPAIPPSKTSRVALDFLRAAGQGVSGRTSRAIHELEPAERRIHALASGEIDLAATFRRLQCDLVAEIDSESASPAALRRDRPARAILVAALVLDRGKSAWIVTRTGEPARWSDRLANALAALESREAGGFGTRAGGDPDLRSTALALLAMNVLEPWLSSRDGPPDAGSVERQAPAVLRQDCEACHASLSPALGREWSESTHARHDVRCADCHGDNHSTIFRVEGRVSPATCGRCHEDAAREFGRTKHATAMKTLADSPLFESTPPAARGACEDCHRIGEAHADGSSGRCSSCHPSHAFTSRAARQPELCAVCHTGDDYPQAEAYWSSRHGALFAVGREASGAPSCATCHYASGAHDDGACIALGGSGRGAALEGAVPALAMPAISREAFHARRSAMVDACDDCHTRRFAEASLVEADRIKAEGDAMLDEAAAALAEIVDARSAAGAETLRRALGPDAGWPSAGGPDAPELERFYRMWRFHYASAWKGAYHGSASVANQRSRPGMRQDLELLRVAADERRAERRSR